MKIVKINSDNYFLDPATSSRIEKYTQGCYFVYGDQVISDLYLDPKSKNIMFTIDNDRHIIDDHYQSMLIRAGYLVYQDYDTHYCENPEEGWVIHDKFVDMIKESIMKLNPKEVNLEDRNRMYFEIYKNNYKYTVIISHISVIVQKNQERKINDLSFYPFDKQMDKYGTVYCSIYAQKLYKDDSYTSRYNAADDLLKAIVSESEGTKYVAMELKQPSFYIQ